MKVKANRKKLLQAAERAMKVTRKSYDTTSLEECFLFEVDGEGITLHACTQVAYLKTGCAYTAADGTFSCAFPYDQFVATLKTARSETVVLELLDHKVQLSGGRIRLQIPCMDPKAWPKEPSFGDPDYELPAGELLGAFRECSHSLPAGENVLPVLGSYCVECTKEHWKVTSMDGRRISIRGDIRGSAVTQNLLQGLKLAPVLGIFGDGARLAFCGEDAMLYDAQSTVYFRTVDGRYFDVERLLVKPAYTVTVSREELQEAFTLALGILPSNEPARLVMDQDLLRVQAVGNASLDCEIPAAFAGERKRAIPIGLNPKYLLDALKTLERETVTVQVGDACVIMEEDQRLELICLCRIR